MALCGNPTCLALPEWTDCCSATAELISSEPLPPVSALSSEPLPPVSALSSEPLQPISAPSCEPLPPVTGEPLLPTASTSNSSALYPPAASTSSTLILAASTSDTPTAFTSNTARKLLPPAVSPSNATVTAAESHPLTSASSKRFDYFVDDDELTQLGKGFTSINTKKNTKWALNNYTEWVKARSLQFPQNPVPANLLQSTDCDLLSMWLSRYVVETRMTSGKRYPPSTIYQLLTALLRIMRASNSKSPNFLDKKIPPSFKQLHGTLDIHFRRLHETGLGRRVRHAEIMTKQEEETLWSQNILGTSSPHTLLNSVFYLNGKNFCLRGGEEHRKLKVSQLQRLSQPDRYLYHENCSKNRAGTFKQLHLDSKVVPIHCTCSSDQQRCHVHILDFYLSKLSPAVVAEEGPFYLRPLSAIPEGDSSPWYTRTPVGRNMLASMLKRMCQRGGIEGHKTNHSLRATGATQLFQAEVPEKIIQERTGHRSLAALRTYERTTSEQHEAVSSLLAARPTVSGPAYINQYRQSKDIQIQQPATSSITIQGCTGCTINIQQPPPQLDPFSLKDIDMDSFLADF